MKYKIVKITYIIISLVILALLCSEKEWRRILNERAGQR